MEPAPSRIRRQRASIQPIAPDTFDEPIKPGPPSRRPRNTLSNVLAVAAVLFAILAVFLYLRPGGGGIAPIPQASPGRNELVNVVKALEGQGLAVQQPPGLFVTAGALGVPGQGVEIAGNPAFIFLFQDASRAAAAAKTADPASVSPATRPGTPTPEGERRLAQGSNVVVVMLGGDDATWQKVGAAIASLP